MIVDVYEYMMVNGYQYGIWVYDIWVNYSSIVNSSAGASWASTSSTSTPVDPTMAIRYTFPRLMDKNMVNQCKSWVNPSWNIVGNLNS